MSTAFAVPFEPAGPGAARILALVTPGTAPGATELVTALLALGVVPLVALTDEHRDRLLAEHDVDVAIRLDTDSGSEPHADPAAAGQDLHAVDVVTAGRLPGTAAWALEIAIAVTRRAPRPTTLPLSYGALRVDVPRRTVTCSGREVAVSPLQFRLLCALVEAAGAVVTRRELSTALFGTYLPGDADRLEAHIRRVRRRLCVPAGDVIVTVRSEGWRIAEIEEVVEPLRRAFLR